MAGISFDDLTPKKSSAVSFDDLVAPEKAHAGSALEATGIALSGGQLPFGNVITSRIAAEATAPFLKQDGEGWRDAASRLYDEAQAYTKATQEAHPTATTIGNVAGILSTLPAAFSKPVTGGGIIATPAKGLKGVSDFTTKMVSATPFKGSGIASKAGNIAARSAGGAAVSAPIGGLYAAGDADAGQRGDAFLKGAGTSAVIGATLPVAGAVLAPVISKAEESIAKKVIQSRLKGVPVADDIANSALDKVIQRLKADYPDTNDLQDVLNKFTYGNKSLAELGGERTINLGKGAAQYPTGEAITKEKFLPRVGEAPENIKKSVGRYISGKSDYYSTLDDLLSQGQAKAAPMYQEAFKLNPSVSSQRLDNILNRPAARDALKTVAQDYQNKAALLASPDPELTKLAKELADLDMMAETRGGVSGGLKLSALDAIKKELDMKVRGAKRAMDMGTDNGNTYRALNDVRAALVDEIDRLDKTGLYAKARKTAGDYLSSKAAMEAGVDYKKIDSPLIQRKISAMSPAEKNAFKVGVVKSIRDDIDNITEGGNIYQRVFGRPDRQKQLKAILGNDYLKLEKDLLAEDRIFKIRNEVLANSSTASKQKAAQEFESFLASGAQDVATMGATAGSISTATRAAKMFIGKMFDGISDKTAGDVARILYETDPKEKVKILNSLRKSAVLPQDKQAIAAYFSMSDVLKNKQKLMSMPAAKVNAIFNNQEEK